MKKPIDRIEEYINYKGLSLNAFDISIGKSGGYTGKQIKNKASIGVDVLHTIVSIYEELNADWVVTGKGNMIREEFAKPKTIDELIEEKIEAKLRGVTIEDLKTLMMVKEFSEAQKLEAKKAMEKEQAKQK
ncbi:hypothetical protein [Aquimarina sp. AU58]|uniref:hypothetical protein n=1 Tax=Aquimarina sp. AU58 TaxID=1874112 RepID=UPI001F180661|nr:hypothetical protein [Aquimarina sp. AU58]